MTRHLLATISLLFATISINLSVPALGVSQEASQAAPQVVTEAHGQSQADEPKAATVVLPAASATKKIQTASLSSGGNIISFPKQEEQPLYVIGLIMLAVCVAQIIYILTLWEQRKALQKKLEEVTNVQNQKNTHMEFQALYDPLTQLPNRRLFRDRLLNALKLAYRQSGTFGVLMADLDHFKEVNDTMGHDAGDLLLMEVANRLRKTMRASDTIARLGGDEFAFICVGMRDLKTASLVCMNLIQAFEDPIIVKGRPFKIGISLGIALYPEHATDDEMLVRRADTALYRAKEQRNTFILYDNQIDRPR